MDLITTPAIRIGASLLSIALVTHVWANDALDAHMKAVGGADAVAQIKTIRRAGSVTGTSSFGDLHGTFVEAVNLDPWFGYASLNLSIGGTEYRHDSGWTNDVAWTRDPQSGVKNTPDWEADFASHQYAPSPLASLIGTNQSIEHLGASELNGKTCDSFRAKGSAGIFHVNQDTHLLEGISIPGVIQMTLEDYSVVQGVQLPGKRVLDIIVINMTLVYDFGETTIDEPVDRGRCEKPNAHPKKRVASETPPSSTVTATMAMQYLDRDQDQVVSLEEYLRSRPDDPAGKMLDEFKSLDTNHDGEIDLAEAAVMAKYINQGRAESGQHGSMDAGTSQNHAGDATAGEMVSAKQIIESMDRNGDGQITPGEAIDDVRVAFDELDSNGDGAIDLVEAEAMAEFANQSSGASKGPESSVGITAKQLVDHLDQDNDRRISLEEANDDLKPHFSFLDTNGDGFLDVVEAKAIAVYANRNQ